LGILRVILGFCRDVNEICTLLECYAANSGQEVQEDFDFLAVEDWTDRLPQNVGTELPLYGA
jgi:hypothetical protein